MWFSVNGVYIIGIGFLGSFKIITSPASPSLTKQVYESINQLLNEQVNGKIIASKLRGNILICVYHVYQYTL